MRIAIALGLTAGLAALQPASAQSIGSNPTGPYLGATLGAHFYEDDDVVAFDEGGSLGAELGYRFSDNIRMALEAEATGAEIDGSDDDVIAIGRATVGLYYDFQSSDHGLVPYFGGGIGVASGTIESLDDDDGEEEDFDGEFTWHAEAGISLNLNPHVALVPSYRYTWTDNDDGVTADAVTSHAVRVGLRVSF